MVTSEKRKQITMKCRVGQHAVKAEVFPVSFLPDGHVVGAGQTAGLAFFEGGEVAVLEMAFTVDFPNGKNGTHVNYSHFAFQDGSSFTILETGSSADNPDGKTSTVHADSISIFQGRGRFCGIEGTGTMVGTRLAALGANVDTYLDYTLTFTLPEAPEPHNCCSQ